MNDLRANPKVLVTGGSGFIGTNLVDALVRNGIEVTNLDVLPPRDARQHGRWRQGDLRDSRGVREVIRSTSPDAVVHLGARTDLRGTSLGDYAANTDGTRNLLDALAGVEPAPRLLVASTRMVCPIGYQPRADDDYRPPNAYGQSKVLTEQILRDSGYRGVWMIVRPTSIWGPWFDVPYRDFFLAVARGRYRHPAGQRIRKSFGYVENTVHQLLSLLEASPELVHERLFYLADYEPLELSDWATRIGQATGGPSVRTVPLSLLRAGALAGDVLQRLGWREPPLTRFRLDNLLTQMIYDLSPTREVAPTLPVDLETGVRRTADWLHSRGDLPSANAAR